MMPLEGVRVLDLSQVFSGPYCTRILGDLGAEVIKVEATRRPDPERGPIKPAPGSGLYPDNNPGPDPYNRSGRFVEYNRNKYGITLDLGTPEGLHLFLELVKISDVVIENFSVGVMERLGLGYEALRAIQPDIIMLSMPAFGSTGPEASYVAFGPQQEALSGIVSITGYQEDRPLSTWVYYPDPTVALFAVSAVLAALMHRQATGQGQHIELPQREALCYALPELVLEYQMTGRKPRPRGNSHPAYAPHGCYRCQGEDLWVAISVTNDREWVALCQAMGRPDLTLDPRFRTAPERVRNREALDRIVEDWTQKHSHYEAMELLQAAGVPAGAVLTMADMLEDPHYKERGFFVPVDYTGVGIHLSLGFPWRFSKTPASVRLPSPGLGEHNRYILGKLLGLSEAQVRELEEKGIIGSVPRDATDRE